MGEWALCPLYLEQAKTLAADTVTDENTIKVKVNDWSGKGSKGGGSKNLLEL